MRLRLPLVSAFVAASSCCCCCCGDFWTGFTEGLGEEGVYFVVPAFDDEATALGTPIGDLAPYPGAELQFGMAVEEPISVVAVYTVDGADPADVLAHFESWGHAHGYQSTTAAEPNTLAMQADGVDFTVQAEAGWHMVAIANQAN